MHKKFPPLLFHLLCTATILILATIISLFFYLLTKNTTNVAIIYILAVVLTARYTEGYLPGAISAVIGVIGINYFFTYPFFKLNFTLSGYPITFFGMLTISLMISTTTTHIKQQAYIISIREKMLVEAEKEKMRANLLRAISHDLRTPLTSIIGASATYLENQTFLKETEKNQLVKDIHEDSNWLLYMVENLLSVTRIHEDNAGVTKFPEPIEEVVSEAILRLKKRLPDAVIQAKVPNEFLMIPMDATLIEQVIINLLENAVIHAKSSLPIACTVEKEGNWVRFDIIDYGIGIKEEQLPTIFDGTSYKTNQSSDSAKGMGIGLSICKTIIHAHGGRITASNHQNGAKFTFFLPLE